MKDRLFRTIQKLDYYYDLLFGTLILFVVLNFTVANVLLGLLGILFFVDINKSKFKTSKLIKSKVFITLVLLVIYIFIHALFLDDWSGKRLRFCLLFLSIFILSFRITKQVRVFMAFVISVLIVSILGLFNIVNWYLKTGVFDMASGGGIIDELLILNRPYLGFALVIGSILCVYLAGIYSSFSGYFWTIALFFTSYIYLISARISFISLLIVALLYLTFYYRAKVTTKAILLISVAGIISTAIILNKDLLERFYFVDKLFAQSEQLKDSEPRIIIWDCALKIAKEKDFNIIYGLKSVEQLENKLVDCYALDTGNDERRAYFLKVRFNTHNQFLDIYLTLGIIGLSLFLFFIIQLFLQKRLLFHQIAMLVTVILFCSVENMFYVQRGIYLFAFVIAFIMIMDSNKSKLRL